MALIDLICTQCGYKNEELIKAGAEYPPCPQCGAKRKQNYSGKLFCNRNAKACGGNCSGCSGCK